MSEEDPSRQAAEKIAKEILDRGMFGDDKEYRYAVDFIYRAIRDAVERERERIESILDLSITLDEAKRRIRRGGEHGC